MTIDEERFRRVRAVFETVIGLPPDAREARMVDECGDDAALLAEVRRLVALDAQEAPVDAALARGAAAGIDGVRIGRYRLRRLLASGGMGTVYEAEQDEPRRTVALKMLRFGLAGEEARRRFRYEAELLARLDHPGIARIHEAGTHVAPDGTAVPWFALELVEDAVDLVRYAEREGLDDVARLRLFASVCDAVQHGHARGVLHRDLKPSNLIVGRSGRPRVIDYGVARALDVDPGRTTMHTRVGQVVGTLATMSPEQLAGDPRAVDARTDVYALGAVLFELLAGRPHRRLEGKSLPEIARIAAAPPERLGEVRPALRGDLEWIVARALEPDPERRYATVAALADDVRRALAHEPVLAGPPTFTYRFARLVRRHRALAAVSAAALLLVVVFAVVAAVGFVEARRSSTLANERLAVAQAEARKAAAMNDFLVDVLRAPDPGRAGPDVRVVDLLETALAEARRRFEDAPEVRGALLTAIGTAYQRLTRPDEAEEPLAEGHRLLEAALGREALETLSAALALMNLRLEQNRWEDAEAILAPVAALRDHPDPRLRSMAAIALAGRARVLLDAGRLEEAEAALNDVLAIRTSIGEDDPLELVPTVNGLVVVLGQQGKLEPAEALASDLLARIDPTYRDDDAQVQELRRHLAIVRQHRGDLPGAEALLREVLAWQTRALGEAHQRTLNTAFALGALLRQTGKIDEAAALLEATEPRLEAILGPTHLATLESMSTLALVRAEQGRTAEAFALHEELLSRYDRRYPDGHPRGAVARAKLADLLAREGRLDEALAQARRAAAELEALAGSDHPDLSWAREVLDRAEAAAREVRDDGSE